MIEQDFRTLTTLLAQQGGFEKEKGLSEQLQAAIAVKGIQNTETWLLLKKLIFQLGPVQEQIRHVQKTLTNIDSDLYAMIGDDWNTLLRQLGICFAPIMKLANTEEYYLANQAVRISLGLAFYYGLGIEQNYEHASDILKREASANNPEAWWLLGKFRSKLDIPVDEAVEYMNAAAKAGLRDAQYLMGNLYLGKWSDYVIEQPNPKMADQYYRQAAAQEHAGALYFLYSIRKNGNESRRSRLFKRALEAGSEDALEIQGKEALQKAELKLAVKSFLPVACHGLWRAQVYLAYIYNYVGKTEEALKWCTYAAGMNRSEAQAMLGRIYEDGRLGLEQNSRRAEMWYKEAVRNESGSHASDDVRAHLLNVWKENKEWKLHEEEIEDYLKQIDLDKYPDVQELIGDLYITNGVFLNAYQWNPEKARSCYEGAAEHGNISAMLKAAHYELEGKGGPRNPQKAVQYLKNAADLGKAQAALKLGDILSGNTVGVPEDKAAAAKYYVQAADAELPDACVRFGDCCFFGSGVPQSYEEAVKYYQKAVGYRQQSDLIEHAHAQLAKCYREGLGVEVSDREAFKHQLLASHSDNTVADGHQKIQQEAHENNTETATIVSSEQKQESSKSPAVISSGNVAPRNLSAAHERNENPSKYEMEPVKSEVDFSTMKIPAMIVAVIVILIIVCYLIIS